jgi:hypothetical protein
MTPTVIWAFCANLSQFRHWKLDPYAIDILPVCDDQAGCTATNYQKIKRAVLAVAPVQEGIEIDHRHELLTKRFTRPWLICAANRSKHAGSEPATGRHARRSEVSPISRYGLLAVFDHTL